MNLHIGDGFEFMENHHSEFDVVIADTSDPEGRTFCKLFNNQFKIAV